MIKQIIFDFGDVFYRIDPSKTQEAFIRLGFQMEDYLKHQDLFLNLEKGIVSPDDFRSQLQLILLNRVSQQQIEDAWNALLIGYVPDRIRLLEKITNHYQLFLLSNTNQIHLHTFWSELEESELDGMFKNSFSKLYFSHQMGMRKPDPEIFQYVLREQHLQASEVLFIDDSVANVQTAIALGMHGFVYDPTKNFEQLFDSDGRLLDLFNV